MSTDTKTYKVGHDACISILTALESHVTQTPEVRALYEKFADKFSNPLSWAPYKIKLTDHERQAVKKALEARSRVSTWGVAEALDDLDLDS